MAPQPPAPAELVEPRAAARRTPGGPAGHRTPSGPTRQLLPGARVRQCLPLGLSLMALGESPLNRDTSGVRKLKAKSFYNRIVIIPKGMNHWGHFYQYLSLCDIIMG